MVLPAGKRQKKHFPHPLQIFRQYTLVAVPQQKLRKLALAIFKKERIAATHRISLVFCSDHAIRKLNACYRKINRATDVLSFPMGDKDLLGEIYISLERAKAQAASYKTPCNTEIIRLFVHGFFHLLGYDHKKPGERETMEKKESLYL